MGMGVIRRRWLTPGYQETSGVMETFILLIVVMGSWVCTYVKANKITQFK